MSLLLHCWLLLAYSSCIAPGQDQKKVADETVSSSSQEWSAELTGLSKTWLIHIWEGLLACRVNELL